MSRDPRRDPVNIPDLAGHIRQTLAALGEDPEREGLTSTPERAAKALAFLTQGYETRLEDVVRNALFTTANDEMVILKDIELFSLCEHHMLPFFGRVHIGYLPDGKVIGVSKLARIVDLYARRLQIQEQMTSQIANFLHSTLQPQGVAVVVEGMHMCSMMRGVKKANASMKTSKMLGAFKDDDKTRREFITHINTNS